MGFVDDKKLERKRIIKDKIAGIFNRSHIIENDIIVAQKHIMQKYGLSAIDALTMLSNLVIDKKIDVELDEFEYKHSFLKVYRIKNIKQL
nr:MAG TPA: hypothetical protein [Caudoviricetes sp.]